MEYVVCLKKEIELLNERDAQKRYLELTAMGYKEQDILVAAPVPVQAHLEFGQNIGAQGVPVSGYPMTMPGAAEQNTGINSGTAMATENGEFEPVQTDMEMSIFRDTGNPSPNEELPSDTIS